MCNSGWDACIIASMRKLPLQSPRETSCRDVKITFLDRDMRCWQRYNARERDCAFYLGKDTFAHAMSVSSLPSTERDLDAREGKEDVAGQIPILPSRSHHHPAKTNRFVSSSFAHKPGNPLYHSETHHAVTTQTSIHNLVLL